jgi:hypothetical protein
MRRFAPEAVIGPVVRDTSKGAVAHLKPPSDSVARASESAQPAWVIVPQYKPGESPQLTPMPKAHAFMRVAENTFNYSLLGARGFEALAGFMDSTDCFEFSYGQLEEAIALFAALPPPSRP